MKNDFAIQIFGRGNIHDSRGKFFIYEDFEFSLCFENDLYPGYVTEKLIDSYISGCVPLYWGSLRNESILNPDAFTNLNDFQTIAEFRDHVVSLSERQKSQMLSQPLLIDKPDLEKIESIILG